MRAFLIPALASMLFSATPAAAQTASADTILINGKIVTVDDRFTIAQALAIRDRRIVAVGTNAEIAKLKGPQTRTVELAGRTVIPGLIDNHSHWIRAAEHNELRFDGVTTRKRAIALLTERVSAAKPGEWIAVLGGWSEQQFTDEERGFSRAELDSIAPNNPVVLQSVYNHSFLNSAALKAAAIDESTANPPGGTIEKDSCRRADRRREWRRRGRLRRRQGAARRPGDLVREHPQICVVPEFARHHGVVGPRRPRHEPQALRAVPSARRRRRAERARVLAHDPRAGDARADGPRARGNSGDGAVPGQRLFRPHRLGRRHLCWRDHQHHARGRTDEPGRDGAGAPPRGRARAAGPPLQRPCRDADGDRRLPRAVRVREQGSPDPRPALGLLASRSGHRGAARPHEAARHVGAAPQPSADPGRADAQDPRRQGLGHATVPPRAGLRHPLGARLRRHRSDAVQPVLHARASR